MKILTEYELRAKCLGQEVEHYRVAADVFVTPLAKEYLRDRGIRLEIADTPAEMPQVKASTQGPKPEEMTHLNGSTLVPKTHPRIRLRGRLDSLESRILELQLAAHEQGNSQLIDQLGELLEQVRVILGCEVRETPLPAATLLGLDSDGLRRVSHNVRQEFGFGHPVPDYRMGRLPVLLNSLRTQVRETELEAVAAFAQPDGTVARLDLVQALNRLSSAVYILFCQQLAKGGLSV